MTKIHDIRARTPRSNGTRNTSSIKYIARHHSGGSTGNFDAFWLYWNRTLGWGTGGYHEIILRDGSVELCYDPNEITNGVANHNSYTYHICVVGNGSFTVAQEKAFKERCLRALKLFNLPVSRVLGHNEFKGASTACPGINMDVVRRSLQDKSTPSSTKVIDPMDKGYLMYGDRGQAVKDMQALLVKAGFPNETSGFLNAESKRALMDFQAKYKLEVDGYYGKASQAKLKDVTKGSATPVEKTRFSDVPKTHPAYQELEKVVKAGLLSGFHDGTFRMDETVTRRQMVTILARLLDRE